MQASGTVMAGHLITFQQRQPELYPAVSVLFRPRTGWPAPQVCLTRTIPDLQQRERLLLRNTRELRSRTLQPRLPCPIPHIQRLRQERARPHLSAPTREVPTRAVDRGVVAGRRGGCLVRWREHNGTGVGNKIRYVMCREGEVRRVRPLLCILFFLCPLAPTSRCDLFGGELVGLVGDSAAGLGALLRCLWQGKSAALTRSPPTSPTPLTWITHARSLARSLARSRTHPHTQDAPPPQGCELGPAARRSPPAGQPCPS